MSMGIGAKAVLIQTNDASAVYKYYSFDDNVPERKQEKFDGKIILHKRCFIEHQSMSALEMIANNLLMINNCSNAWSISDDRYKIDMMVLRILGKMFIQYDTDNKIPEQVFYYC